MTKHDVAHRGWLFRVDDLRLVVERDLQISDIRRLLFVRKTVDTPRGNVAEW